MAEALRLGVVGANPRVGWASRTHLPAILGLKDFDLTAVCTTKRESAEESAAKYEAKRAYWDYRNLVADPEVEVVDVCVRVPYHHEIAMAALEAGKHVYCEWPLGATTAQAVQLAETAAKGSRHAMVGLQARAAPSWIHLRTLIAQGWVGRVTSATMTQFQPGLLQERGPEELWRADPTNGANTLTIGFGHAIDAFCWCLGSFTEVSGVVATVAPEWPLRAGGAAPVTAPDYVSVLGRLAGGAVASASVAAVPWHGSRFRMEIYGTEGTIVATAAQAQAMGLRLQGARHDAADLHDIEVPADLRWVPAEVPEGTPVNVAQMMHRFAEGIHNGGDPAPTFEDAVRLHRLLDAIVEASRSGKTVRLPA